MAVCDVAHVERSGAALRRGGGRDGLLDAVVTDVMPVRIVREELDAAI